MIQYQCTASNGVERPTTAFTKITVYCEYDLHSEGIMESFFKQESMKKKRFFYQVRNFKRSLTQLNWIGSFDLSKTVQLAISKQFLLAVVFYQLNSLNSPHRQIIYSLVM